MRRLPLARPSDDGSTLIQLLLVVALAATILGISLGGFNSALETVRGDSSMNIVQWQLKLAREAAINQRRSIELRFTMPNYINVVRRRIPYATVNDVDSISTAVLQHQTQFYLFTSMPDTPDSFGRTTALSFNGAAAVMFNADGQFADGAGNLVNGTIFIGKPTSRMTARALTIFGPTSQIRTWRWNGSAWRH